MSSLIKSLELRTCQYCMSLRQRDTILRISRSLFGRPLLELPKLQFPRRRLRVLMTHRPAQNAGLKWCFVLRREVTNRAVPSGDAEIIRSAGKPQRSWIDSGSCSSNPFRNVQKSVFQRESLMPTVACCASNSSGSKFPLNFRISLCSTCFGLAMASR